MPLFLERYLKKERAEDITYSDLELLLRQGVDEHQTLEYKPRGLLVKQDDTVVKESDPKQVFGFTALAKSVAGFANAEGGLLVLGVKEKEEKHKGTLVKIKPGKVHPLPLNITREMIENQLAAHIQFPIEGVTIVPLRKSARSKGVVYLLDVPQSLRAPHRVNELYYFQRYNFSTVEMKHYQVADLFGKRLAPSLGVETSQTKGMNEDKGHFTIRPLIHNRGRAVAKFVTCLCRVAGGHYKIMQSQWHVADDHLGCQYATGFNSVIYPEIPTDTGYIEFQPVDELDKQSKEPLVLQFTLLAEGMIGKQVVSTIQPQRASDLESIA